jgi:hypothetical protein
MSIGSRDRGSPPTTSMLANALFRLTRMMRRPKFASIVSTALYFGATQPGDFIDLDAGERRDGDRENRVDRQAADERFGKQRAPLTGIPANAGEGWREERVWDR